MSDDEDISAALAALDQAKAFLSDRAMLLGSYFHDLLAQGFSRPEALDLTIAQQESLDGDD